jgi:ubiquinone/menaquinone biosynthesis C-methylase UbiE
MVEVRQVFDDSAGYERFMGCWSRAVGELFLDWIAVPPQLEWLDVGCGTGIFTELVATGWQPSRVTGVDPAQAQIDLAAAKVRDARVAFRTADAQALPFADASFDAVTAALVVNFVPDRTKALSEMRRVVRPSGVVAGYVWDFAANASPSGPLRAGMRRAGIEAPEVPGTQDSTEARLRSLLAEAGFRDIAMRSMTVKSSYSDFEDFWEAQTPGYNPISKVIAGLESSTREQLRQAVRAEVGAVDKHPVEYAARANAFMARPLGDRAEKRLLPVIRAAGIKPE